MTGQSQMDHTSADVLPRNGARGEGEVDEYAHYGFGAEVVSECGTTERAFHADVGHRVACLQGAQLVGQSRR